MVNLFALLAQTQLAVPPSGEQVFTPTNYVLAGVIAVLASTLVKCVLEIRALNKERDTLQEARRQTEVQAYKDILPLTTKIVDNMNDLHAILERVETALSVYEAREEARDEGKKS